MEKYTGRGLVVKRPGVESCLGGGGRFPSSKKILGVLCIFPWFLLKDQGMEHHGRGPSGLKIYLYALLEISLLAFAHRKRPLCCGALLRNLGTTPILKKRSRSEKAILGATLGIPGHSRSNSRNGTHDLIYVKTQFSEQLSERLSELVGRQNFSPNSRSVFFKIGVVPAHQNYLQQRNSREQGMTLRYLYP